MSIVRIGTTKKYADGWDAIFAKKRKKTSSKKTSRTAGTRRGKTASRKKR
jgi:hypothetical protein